ncbi:MAG: hypothetical protein BGO96_11925 [Micrococcales bacterium 73-15]|nr:MAG: hypothetical protein BGO96_11925 [Micrococcales bacterium 73-15]
MTMPAPTPVPRLSVTNEPLSRPSPNHSSAAATALSGFSITMGRPRWSRTRDIPLSCQVHSGTRIDVVDSRTTSPGSETPTPSTRSRDTPASSSAPTTARSTPSATYSAVLSCSSRATWAEPTSSSAASNTIART